MVKQREEPVKGVKYGSYRGPTGRYRDLYDVRSVKRDGSLWDSKKAYGRVGVREAKHAIHKRTPHTWLKYRTYNQTKGHFVK